MQHARHVRCTLSVALFALTIVFLFLTAMVFAKEKKKEYPESGKVTAINLNQIRRRGGGGANGSGSHIERKYVYRVETETRIYELECENSALFSTPVCKRNGKPIALGDALQFRIEKEWAYVPKEPDSDSEPRFRVLSTEMKETNQTDTGDKPTVP